MARASSQTSRCAVCSPHPFPATFELETWTRSPLFLAASGDGEAVSETGSACSLAAAPHSQGCQPGWLPVTAPPPSPLLFPRWGLRREEPVSSPLGVPPFPPHPPCRGSQENDLSCWGGGGGGAGAGAQRAHSHTAAHCSCPAPSRPPHCGDTCPPGSAPAATPAPTNPIPGLGMCP